ncbi:MAG: hypothetical protein KDG50_00375 [Chromatiales bacterium]|nr:hypothetical protein [Chromatiales bacterium]
MSDTSIAAGFYLLALALVSGSGRAAGLYSGFGRSLEHRVEWAFLAVFIVAAIVVGGLFRSRCPKCRRFAAFLPTGETRSPAKTGKLRWQEQVRCKHCGHERWRDRQSESTGVN